ncbi:MAG TPA: alkaline phosphatase family protein [Thermoplasmata archaeon]|nr:alkaline phosphatase family protein [Thermoplasmata archaeon]
MSQRLLVIGLDSASPEYLFGRCLPFMPTVRGLLERGRRATLRTTDPPISIPAWAVMFTGVDPGSLGLYGFRHRKNHSYTDTYGPSSDRLPVPTFWELLSQGGRRVGVVGMPPGYPAPKVNGVYISDFLTPPEPTEASYPRPLLAELEERYGPYVFDVTFRAQEREQLFRDLVAMTQQHFAVAEELYTRERWDVFAIHEVGTDRLHHAYTQYFDPSHHSYRADNPFAHVLEQYYRGLDRSIARLTANADEETLIVLASDHGSMPMEGCFCVNSWLAERGYLALGVTPDRPTALEKTAVDWGRTRIWGAGGYYARIFFNVRGREPNGVVAAADVPRLRDELTEALARLIGPDGRPMRTEVLDPATVYRAVRGDPPDLMVYFGDLKWRSAGTLGHPSLFLRENDTGPDDAVHTFDGIFALCGAWIEGGDLPPQSILDVTPTLLQLMGEPIPPHVQGAPMALGAAGLPVSRNPTSASAHP